MSLAQQETTAPLPKMAYAINEAVHVSGRCRTSIYEAINDGTLKARKSGRRTLIMASDLERWLASFPEIAPKNAA